MSAVVFTKLKARKLPWQRREKKNSFNIEIGIMLVSVLLAATSFPIAKNITFAMPAAAMMCVRFLFAALIFAPYVFIKNGWRLPKPERLLTYLVLSIPLVGFFWAMFESLRYTSVMNTGALYCSVPAITAVYAFIINKERQSLIRTLGLLLGTFGALWIVFKGDLNALLSLSFNRGDIIFLMGCLLMGIYNPLIKKFYKNEPMEVMTFWVLLSAGVILAFVSFSDLTQIEWLEIPFSVYSGLAYVSIFTTLITFFLVQFCTVKIGATRVASFGLLTPLFVMVLSVVTGFDEFKLILLPGILLVVLALFIIQRK